VDFEYQDTPRALGKLNALQVDSTEKYVICTFDNNLLAVFDIETGALIKADQAMEGVNFQDVLIDDIASFMGCLD
jgi:tricorn protease-like protein